VLCMLPYTKAIHTGAAYPSCTHIHHQWIIERHSPWSTPGRLLPVLQPITGVSHTIDTQP
jgi:hypothetical protein